MHEELKETSNISKNNANSYIMSKRLRDTNYLGTELSLNLKVEVSE